MVMVVDDDESVRLSLARLFRSAQIPFSIFESSEAFLAKAPLDAAGCLIVDVQLPGMRGLELQAQCVRTRPALAIVVMTAFNDDETEQKALAAGAIAFLRKPFDCNALLQLVRDALDADSTSSAA